MNIKKTIVISGLMLAGVALFNNAKAQHTDNTLSQAEKAAGWKLLFDAQHFGFIESPQIPAFHHLVRPAH